MHRKFTLGHNLWNQTLSIVLSDKKKHLMAKDMISSKKPFYISWSFVKDLKRKKISR
jgi:hypothetical protein